MSQDRSDSLQVASGAPGSAVANTGHFLNSRANTLASVDHALNALAYTRAPRQGIKTTQTNVTAPEDEF
jgi:hypothetical protein